MYGDTYKPLDQERNSYKREVTHNVHCVPLFAENLADLASAHHLVCGRNLWPTLPREDHEGVHGTFWSSVRVERLRN